MRHRIAFLVLLLALAATACKRATTLEERQRSYEVVNEGSAGGVSTTINAPGEAPPPPLTTTAPLTNTNADTTSSFSLGGIPGQTDTAAGAPGSIAATFPSSTGGMTPRAIPARPRPAAQPRSAPPESEASESEETTETGETSGTEPKPAEPPAAQPLPTEPKQPPATDTTATRPPQE